MRQTSTIRQRLAGIGLVGLPLLSFPLVSLPEGDIAGLPATYCYLFGVWIALIVLAAWVSEKRGR